MKARQSSQKLFEKSVWEPQLDAPVSEIQLLGSNLSLFCTLGVNILEHSSAELVKGMKSRLGESVCPHLLACSGKISLRDLELSASPISLHQAAVLGRLTENYLASHSDQTHCRSSSLQTKASGSELLERNGDPSKEGQHCHLNKGQGLPRNEGAWKVGSCLHNSPCLPTH